MLRLGTTVLLLALLAASFGCRKYGMVPLFHPGPAPAQQRDDAYWDPYPHDETHDVSMSDLRPRDFDRPMAEVKRAQTTPHDAGARDGSDYVPVSDALR